MKYDYSEILNEINSNILLHQEDEFIYFLDSNPKLGLLLLEECNDHVIIWKNELKTIDYKSLYSKFIELLPVSIYIVYIETDEEYSAVLELGGDKIDFSCNDCEGYSMKFGSYILKK